MTFYCVSCYLPKEHLAVLSRKAGAVSRAALLQQTRLVGVTSYNIAAHFPKSIIH